MDDLECDQEYVYEGYAHNNRATSRCDRVNTRFDSCRLELGLSLPLSVYFSHPKNVT